MNSRMKAVALCAAALAAACSDATQPVGPAVQSGAASATKTTGGENYVAIGTSISMGWASNGVYAGSQKFAFPELLRFRGQGPISLPLIEAPGCYSPLVAPLGANLRLSGEGFVGSAVCAPNKPGVQLPTQDLGMAGATALDILVTTPETALPVEQWFARVLPANTTALQAALGQQPTLVSIELGANEVLNATSGLAVVGVTIFPPNVFNGLFDQIVGAVKLSGAKGLIVGVPTDGRNFPNFRRGDEVWADRAEFAALNVTVAPNCNGNQNYINISIESIELVFLAAGSSAQVFSCADVPGAQDLTLTPTDITLVNGVLQTMAQHQQQAAAAAGYAFFSLDELYGRADLKPPVYSVISQLTSSQPYGPFISLDGLHPSPLGQSILAAAAANALNTTYPGIAAHGIGSASDFADQLVRPATPLFDLAWAKRIARQYRGQQIPTCLVPGGCTLRLPSTPR